ncbi:hypothetical protein AVEN_31916-1, partial [Araneus ventricosus]
SRVKPVSGVKRGSGLKPVTGVKPGSGLKPGTGVKSGTGVKPGSGVKPGTLDSGNISLSSGQILNSTLLVKKKEQS